MCPVRSVTYVSGLRYFCSADARACAPSSNQTSVQTFPPCRTIDRRHRSILDPASNNASSTREQASWTTARPLRDEQATPLAIRPALLSDGFELAPRMRGGQLHDLGHRLRLQHVLRVLEDRVDVGAAERTLSWYSRNPSAALEVLSCMRSAASGRTQAPPRSWRRRRAGRSPAG